MTSTLTFDQVQNIVLAKAREIDTCGLYHDTLIATNWSELIQVANKSPEQLYNRLLVGDDILNSVPVGELTAQGVYYSGSYNISNPTQPVIIIGATVNITMTGTNRQTIYLLYGSANITCNDKSRVDFMACKETVCTFTITGNANPCIMIKDNAQATITAGNNSTFKVQAYANSVVTCTLNNNAFALLFANTNSSITYTINDDAVAREKSRDSGTIINNSNPNTYD